MAMMSDNSEKSSSIKSTMIKLGTRLRLLFHFSVTNNDNSESYTLEEIKSILVDNENKGNNTLATMRDAELGILIRQVFPLVRRHQLRINGKRTWVYDMMRIPSSKEDILSYNDLCSLNEVPCGWSLTSKTSTLCEWIHLDSFKTVNGSRIIRELHVDNNMNLSLTILNRVVPQYILGIVQLRHAKSQFFSLLNYFSSVDLCNGLLIETNVSNNNKRTYDHNGNVIGETERWSERKPTDINHKTELHHRSTQCEIIIHGNTQNDKRLCLCDSCAKLKKNCRKTIFKGMEEPNLTVNRKRESIMSTAQLKAKLQEEKKRRKNAERREMKLKNIVAEGMKVFNEEDDKDFTTIFNQIDKSCVSDQMLLFWEEQAKAIKQKDSRGRRWHPKVIRTCLSIWNRSPEAYRELKESGTLLLPSGRLLQLYKNSCSQKPGFNDDVGNWMAEEASQRNIGIEGREGGIILDEMSIQEDLQLKSVDGVWKLIGLVELGDEHRNMQTLLNGDEIDQAEVASHVLQFVFLGNSGFRFPFAHFPTKEADPASIYVNFWKAVGWLNRYGFNVTFCCCDGGQKQTVLPS